MKTKISLQFFSIVNFAFFAALLFISGCCTNRYQEQHYTIYRPIYKPLDEVRNSVKVEGPQELENPGKIYIYGNYLLINEVSKGVHIINNTDPSAPQFVAFINIPGSSDMAVKNNVLYANSYIDLLAFNISDPSNTELVNRVKGIFPNPFDVEGVYVDENLGIQVGWTEKDTVYSYEYSDCDDYSPVYYRGGGAMEDGGGWVDAANSDAGGGGTTPTGIGGSMARFTLYDNYLYAVDRQNLQVFDISEVTNPKAWSKINIGWNIETIFPYKDKLFIGSINGMFIYDNSTPWNPVMLTQFNHARSCDPVVADDNYAYVTLRGGTRCGGFSNQLDIVNIADLMNPKLVKSYPMQEPYGLGIDGKTLFICDGNAGLKIFNVEKPEDIELLNWQSGINTYDVILYHNVALMIGKDGLYQYDYSDPKNLKMLSKIPVTAD